MRGARGSSEDARNLNFAFPVGSAEDIALQRGADPVRASSTDSASSAGRGSRAKGKGRGAKAKAEANAASDAQTARDTLCAKASARAKVPKAKSPGSNSRGADTRGCPFPKDSQGAKAWHTTALPAEMECRPKTRAKAWHSTALPTETELPFPTRPPGMPDMGDGRWVLPPPCLSPVYHEPRAALRPSPPRRPLVRSEHCLISLARTHFFESSTTQRNFSGSHIFVGSEHCLVSLVRHFCSRPSVYFSCHLKCSSLVPLYIGSLSSFGSLSTLVPCFPIGSHFSVHTVLL